MKTRIFALLLICLSLSLVACSPISVNSKTVDQTIPAKQVTPKSTEQTTSQTTTAVAATPHVLLGSEYKPSGQWCFNDNHKICLDHINWSTYNSSNAKASANFQYCPPNAQQSSCGYGKAVIEASEAATKCGGLHFTRLQMITGSTSLSFNYGPVVPNSQSCGFSSGDDVTVLTTMTGSQVNSSGASSVEYCNQSAQSGYVFLQNVRGWSCSKALADVEASESVMAGARPFNSPAGFSCGAITNSGAHLDQYTTMRCISGSRAYRFTVKVY